MKNLFKQINNANYNLIVLQLTEPDSYKTIIAKQKLTKLMNLTINKIRECESKKRLNQ